MDRTPLYAQFDGDEVDGKRYPLGEKLDDDTDPGTTAFLVAQGRFASTAPGDPLPITVDQSKPVREMSRGELLIELGNGADDDQLREAVEAKREKLADDAALANADADARTAPARQRSRADDGTAASYADLKDKPLGELRTAELETVAKEEGVDLTSAKTNPDRVAAIEEARKAKSEG